MAYEKWFVRRPDLLQQEIESFADAGFDFKIIEKSMDEDGIIIFEGHLVIQGKDVKLQLVYPAEFPHFPIVVFSPDTILTRHQHPFLKNLCVIPHNQDGWEPTMTGDFMVRQAIKLLTDSEAGAEAVAEHEVDAPEPWSNYLQFGLLPVYISASLPDDLPKAGKFELALYPGKYFNTDHEGHMSFTHYQALEKLTAHGWSGFNFPKPFVFQEDKPFQRPTGYWFKLDNPPDFKLYNDSELFDALYRHFPELSDTVNEIRRQIRGYRQAKPTARKQMSQPQIAILFPEENFERGHYRTTFIWGVFHHEADGFIWSQPQFFSVSEHFKRIPELAPLYDKKVLVLGVGSLGSAVALELGKGGIGSFYLCDYDRLDFGNLSRHTGTLPYLGIPKTMILRHQIRSHFPFSQVEIVDVNLGNVNPSHKKDGSFLPIYEKIRQVDLVIDSSADARVTRIINRMAVQAQVPIIHAWVSNGAWGGRAIRYLPGVTGCYHCFANNIIDDLASAPIGEIYPGGCGFPTFTGASHDIYELATHVVRMACNTLLHRETADHIAIEHYPPKISLYPIGKIADCPICGDGK